MKITKSTLILIFSLLSLSACNSSNNPLARSHDNTIPSDISIDPNWDSTEDTSFIEESIEPYVDDGTKKELEIYAYNDFHGAILEENQRIGALKFFSYLKKENLRDNVLSFDQGDSFQGSIYSNYNYGELVLDLMSEAKISARTLGNHDFDWGISKVKALKNHSYNDYLIPTLGANIYNYNFDIKQAGTIQQRDLAIPSYKYKLANGLTVGVLGVIGENQITSITSSYMHDLTFKNHIEVIKNEATKLKEAGCALIIASIHTGQEDVIGHNLSDYVDLVLCSHTHQEETYKEGNLYYYQSYAYGGGLTHITLTYESGKVSVDTSKTSFLHKEDIERELNDETDKEIEAIINKYNKECEEVGGEVLASNVKGNFRKDNELPNLMCKAMYTAVYERGYDAYLSFVNASRSYINKSTWTYSDIYQSFPFDNEVYLIEVSGYEIRDEIVNYNNVYIPSGQYRDIKLSNKYLIATIDYLAFHTNERRFYDYFPDNNGNYIAKLDLNYREILRDYLLDNYFNSGVTLSSGDYSSRLSNHSKNFNFI